MKTVGDLLRRLARDRVDAWILFSEMLGGLARSATRGDAWLDHEDVRDRALQAAFEEDQAALRRTDPEVPLGAWAHALVRNCVGKERRERRCRPRLVGDFALRSAAARSQPPPLDLHWEWLTAKQVDAVRMRQRHSERTTAKLLRISRRALRDRLQAAAHRCKRMMLIARTLSESELSAFDRRLVDLRLSGLTYRDIAKRVGRSERAVRERIGTLQDGS